VLRELLSCAPWRARFSLISSDFCCVLLLLLLLLLLATAT
jgi:hypothetical protein